MNCWIFNGKCLDTPPGDYYGFVYLITDDKGKRYWGKKAFLHRKKTKLSQKARVGTRKRISVSSVDSKWSTYWGSSKPLLAYIAERGGTEGFKREVIKLCRDRSSLAYYEMKILVENNVLFTDDCWNGNILSKFFKNKIHE